MYKRFCSALLGVHLYYILRKSTKIVSILEVTSRSLWISTCAPFTTRIEDATQFGPLRPPGPHKNYDSSEATDFPITDFPAPTTPIHSINHELKIGSYL